MNAVLFKSCDSKGTVYIKSFTEKAVSLESSLKSSPVQSQGIKTHGSESRGQGGSTLRRSLDERTRVFYKNKPC